MAKAAASFTCTACGASFSKWSGKCDACGAWNSIVEEAPPEEFFSHPKSDRAKDFLSKILD